MSNLKQFLFSQCKDCGLKLRENVPVCPLCADELQCFVMCEDTTLTQDKSKGV